jgi:acetolactate synthase-1/2/3 large subunit
VVKVVTAPAAARLVRALEQLGVELVFGLPGVHNLSIFKALAGSSIRLVGVRHEQAAVYAADGFARATGRLGVAVVTTGPGAANTLGATGEAMASGSPVLVIATDIPAALRREGVYRGVLHETRDQTAMFTPVTKAARRIDSAEAIAAAVRQDGSLALSAPSGPVYLGVPTDLLTAQIPPLEQDSPREPEPTAVDGLNPADLDRAVELLSKAQRPLIWAGGGALRADAGPLVGEIALALAAPVITTYMSRGLLAPEHPCAVPGPVHTPEVGVLWDEADVVLAVGTDFDGMMTQNWLMPAPPAMIAVNVDAADANKNYACDATLVGDARAVLADLRPRITSRPGIAELEHRLDSIASAVARSVAAEDEQAAALLEIMQRVLPAEAVVVADMCIPGYWLAGYRRVPLPRKLAYPVGWGTLGFAFPASLGAALAGVGPTICVTGDGGFLFACGELATAVQAEIPVTIVLVDDGGYGMLRFDQLHAGDEPFGVDLARPDFAALATSFGVPATTVDGFGAGFEGALARSVATAGPQMIVVKAKLIPPPTTSPRWYRRT